MHFALKAAAAVLVSSLALSAHSAIVAAPLADYNGPFNDSGFPVDLGIVGTFNFLLPGGAVINSATFSGTFGTTEYSTSTAGFDVEIEGDQLTVCVPNDPGCWNDDAPLRPFSFALDASTYLGLMDGSADLRVIQTNGNFVRLGSPTLTVDYSVSTVPEPASFGLVALALAAAGLGARRHVKPR